MNDFQTEQVAEHQSYPMLEFCRDSLRKVSVVYVGWLMLAGVMAFVAYSLNRGSPIGSIPSALIIYYLVAFVHIAFRVKTGGKANILSPDILFVLLYTMFHLGYVTLYALGIIPYSGDVFVFEISIPKALFIINLGLISFLFGYEIIGSRGSSPKVMGHIRIPGLSWCIFGLIFMAIAVVAHLIVVVSMAPYIPIYGYTALQRIDIYSNSFLLTLLWRNAAHLMVLGMVIYTLSSALRYGKLFRSKLALVLVIVYFALVIMEGDRGPILQLGAPLLLVRHYLVKRIHIRYLAVLSVATLILFAGLGVVRTTILKPKTMLEEYKYLKTSGQLTWMSPFIEMGQSFLVVNITSHEVPMSEPYWKGASWRDAAFHIVPFLEGFALRQGWATWPPSVWLTTTYYGPERAGRGFTVAAEGYLNFGYLGVVVELMFFGIFIRWLTIRFSRNPSAVWGIIMLGCIGASIMVIRNHVGIVFSVCAHVMVVAALLNMLLGQEPSYEDETEGAILLPHGDMSYMGSIDS
jgi:oligosaccharide repeat unit polymerase